MYVRMLVCLHLNVRCMNYFRIHYIITNVGLLPFAAVKQFWALRYNIYERVCVVITARKIMLIERPTMYIYF
jgi:hypothetical protein